jgi:hypothetical protein
VVVVVRNVDVDEVVVNVVKVDVEYDEKEDDDSIRAIFRKIDVIDIIDLYYDKYAEKFTIWR